MCGTIAGSVSRIWNWPEILEGLDNSLFVFCLPSISIGITTHATGSCKPLKWWFIVFWRVVGRRVAGQKARKSSGILSGELDGLQPSGLPVGHQRGRPPLQPSSGARSFQLLSAPPSVVINYKAASANYLCLLFSYFCLWQDHYVKFSLLRKTMIFECVFHRFNLILLCSHQFWYSCDVFFKRWAMCWSSDKIHNQMFL